MSKTKSYTQLKADLARIAEQEAAIKKKIAETEKKRKEEAEVIIGKNFLACFSNEDLLSKSSAELRQFVNEICKKAVENRNCKDEDLQKNIGKAFIEVYAKNADINCQSYEEAVQFVTGISQRAVKPVTHTGGFRKKNYPYQNQDNITSGSKS